MILELLKVREKVDHFGKAEYLFNYRFLLFFLILLLLLFIVYPGGMILFFVLCSLGVFVLKQNHVHNLHKESE